ncbi:MAG: response regulator transcription factor [Lacunisphaera sp.]|nr:response regulator transcription factor [Lacunisphaera sp.]
MVQSEIDLPGYARRSTPSHEAGVVARIGGLPIRNEAGQIAVQLNRGCFDPATKLSTRAYIRQFPVGFRASLARSCGFPRHGIEATEPATEISLVIAEDRPALAKAMLRGLAAGSRRVNWIRSCREAHDTLKVDGPDVLILDLDMSGIAGVGVLTKLRREGFAGTILAIGSRDTADARIAAFNAGADHFLAKPFAVEELQARVRAIIRRVEWAPRCKLQHADIVMDLFTRIVTRKGVRVELVGSLFTLLQLLVEQCGRIVSRDAIAERLWGAPGNQKNRNHIDVLICRLRRKLDSAVATSAIKTVKEMGFIM